MFVGVQRAAGLAAERHEQEPHLDAVWGVGAYANAHDRRELPLDCEAVGEGDGPLDAAAIGCLCGAESAERLRKAIQRGSPTQWARRRSSSCLACVRALVGRLLGLTCAACGGPIPVVARSPAAHTARRSGLAAPGSTTRPSVSSSSASPKGISTDCWCWECGFYFNTGM